MNPMLRTEVWQYEWVPDVPEPPEPPTEIDGLKVEGTPMPMPEYHAPAPMISQLAITVWDHGENGERVWIQQDGGMPEELGLDTDDALEFVPEGQPRFVWAFPYDIVRDALESKDWTLASTP